MTSVFVKQIDGSGSKMVTMPMVSGEFTILDSLGLSFDVFLTLFGFLSSNSIWHILFFLLFYWFLGGISEKDTVKEIKDDR
jgi:hypothetical protein